MTFSTDLLFETDVKGWMTLGGATDLALQSGGCCGETDVVVDGSGKLRLGPRACK